MRTKLLSTAAAVGGLLLLAGSAHALTVSIALEQDGGTGATAFTTVASGDGATGFFGAFGAFNINLDTAQGTAGPGPIGILAEPTLASNVQDSTTAAGCVTACTLKVFVTETGLTMPLGPTAKLQSSFTWNAVTGTGSPVNGSGITFSNYISNTNTAYGEGELLASATGNQAVESAPLVFTTTVNDLAATFSETEEYDLVCNGTQCGSQLTNQIISVPEPASLSLLGGALFAVGVWRRRKNRKA